MVRHYALKPKASIRPYLLKCSLRELFGLLSTWIFNFQQVRMYGSLRFKGIVSDHGSTALAVTYIGYGFKNPTNLGLWTKDATYTNDWYTLRRVDGLTDTTKRILSPVTWYTSKGKFDSAYVLHVICVSLKMGSLSMLSCVSVAHYSQGASGCWRLWTTKVLVPTNWWYFLRDQVS